MAKSVAVTLNAPEPDGSESHPCLIDLDKKTAAPQWGDG
jgi:hypothetical protein